MSDKVQKIREEIEKKKQRIWPTNTGEMGVVDTPKQLVQGWLNALTWMEKLIDSLPEEPASKDLELEEEITRYYKSLGIIENAGEIYEWDDMIANIILTARHFAEWQKQQMMKDAIDATILDVDAQTIEFGLWPEKLLDIKEGDKVKIIVIKEN